MNASSGTKAPAPPKGVVPPSAAGGRGGFLSDVIVELGFASREAVEQAVRAARSPGTTVARVLIDSGALSEEQLAHATAERYGIAYIDLASFSVDSSAANLIKPSAAKRYQAVPVGFVGGGLLVAMADPADALGVNDIAVMTKMDVKPAVAARPALDALLDQLPLDDFTEAENAAPDGDGDPEAETTDKPPEPEEPPPAAASKAVFWQADADGGSGLKDALPEKAPVEDGAGGEEAAATLRAQLDGLRAERDGLTAERDELAADRDGLRAERDELTAERGELTAERDELLTNREALRAELDAARSRAESAEQAAAEAEAAHSGLRDELEELRTQVVELEDADRRAEQARAALTQLRDESDSEREMLAIAERELRASLDDEEKRRQELESRLAEVEGSAFAAERAFEELRAAQSRMRGALRALVEPDATGD